VTQNTSGLLMMLLVIALGSAPLWLPLIVRHRIVRRMHQRTVEDWQDSHVLADPMARLTKPDAWRAAQDRMEEDGRKPKHRSGSNVEERRS
jgi:hypothetical protein